MTSRRHLAVYMGVPLKILHEFFHKPETVRVWLNTSHPDLDGHTALEMILANNPNAVLTILENAVAGVPV